MSRWDDPQGDKYVGLKDWQFELLFFLLMGAAKDLTSMGLATTQMRKYAKEVGDLLST